MSAVYLLNHVRELDEEASEVKCVGIYSSEVKAQAAIARLAMQPGFADYPERFEIDSYELDEDNWTEGFVSSDDPTWGSPWKDNS